MCAVDGALDRWETAKLFVTVLVDVTRVVVVLTPETLERAVES